jgi:NNP family nitrate/nitrite transporter-like MFS transporter
MFMNNLSSARSSFRDQLSVARRNHTWIMSWLYIGTFGSFVGFSAAFPLLLKTQFPEVTANLAFLGPLVGSIARPVGGKLADRLGGAKVTYWNFIAMTAAALCLAWALSIKSFPLFLSTFLALFVTTGIGNGSTYRMIPIIVRAFHVKRAQRRGTETEAETEAEIEALQAARRETATVIGIVAAIGALGGYFIPGAFGAIECFVAFYLTCVATTWWCYMRTSPVGQRMSSPADARA